MPISPSERNDDARKFIESVIPHLGHGTDGLRLYEYWLNDHDDTPAFRSTVAIMARRILNSTNADLLRSAIQALAITGNKEDLDLIRPFTEHFDSMVASDATACLSHIFHRLKGLVQLKNEIVDRETLLVFAYAFVKEREQADTLEREYPENYRTCDVLGWVNRRISQFIAAGALHFTQMGDDVITWQDMAAFLFSGKTTKCEGRVRNAIAPNHKVMDRVSFIEYVHAFISGCEEHERMELVNPRRYKLGGPPGWANGCISQFVGAGLTHFDLNGEAVDENLTWKDLEDFLFCGLIIE